MRTQRGTEPVHLARRRTEPWDQIGDREITGSRVVESQDIAARRVMRIGEYFVNSINRPARHLRRLTLRQHLGPVKRCCPGIYRFIDDGAVSFPRRQLAPASGLREFRAIHGHGQTFEYLVICAGNRDPTIVFGGIMTVWHDVHRSGSHPLPHKAEFLKGRSQFIQDTKYRLVQTDVDHLAFARLLPCLHRQQRAHRTIDARHVVRNGRRARSNRRAIWITGQK